MKSCEFILEGNGNERYTGGALGLPYPGTYEQETEPFKTKGQRRMGTLTTEEKYKQNLGIMELIEFMKKNPELREKFKEIQKNQGPVQALEFALEKIGKKLDPVLAEKWSEKYKRSINCNNPKGFSQRAHCQGRKK